MFDTKVSGLSELRAALGDWSAGLESAARANTEQMAAKLVKDAQANFAGSHPKGMPHVNAGSTEFGPMPNVVTGTLRRSIRGDGVRPAGPGVFHTTVGPNTVYARRVELGLAPTGSYPYFGPAVSKLRKAAAGIIAANIARYLH